MNVILALDADAHQSIRYLICILWGMAMGWFAGKARW